MAADVDARRALAVRRIREKNEFKVHLFIYVLVNAMIVLVWLWTGAGFFWPVFVIGFWGIGLVTHAYNAYRGTVITEDQIQREMRKLP